MNLHFSKTLRLSFSKIMQMNNEWSSWIYSRVHLKTFKTLYICAKNSKSRPIQVVESAGELKRTCWSELTCLISINIPLHRISKEKHWYSERFHLLKAVRLKKIILGRYYFITLNSKFKRQMLSFRLLILKAHSLQHCSSLKN